LCALPEIRFAAFLNPGSKFIHLIHYLCRT
jgi:hypothetical protein